MSQNGTLTRKQEKALEFILSSNSIVQASELSGFSRREIHRWLSQPEFKERLKEERARIRQESIEVLKGLFSRSVSELSKLLDSEDEKIVLRACQTVLDYNLSVVELSELDERLRKLEDAKDGVTPLNSQEKFKELMQKINTHLGLGPNV